MKNRLVRQVGIEPTRAKSRQIKSLVPQPFRCLSLVVPSDGVEPSPHRVRAEYATSNTSKG